MSQLLPLTKRSPAAAPDPENASLYKPLVTIFGVIFLEFLIMGISLGVIPIYVHETLQFSNLLVGVVIGAQYFATLATRHIAGKSADIKGGKRTASTGLALTAISGVFCLLSVTVTGMPVLSLSSLIIGRILLGVGESFLVIGIFAWGFILVGPKNIGRVMVWNGMGMYAGMACGAPIGVQLSAAFSLRAAFALMFVLPAISYLVLRLLKTVPTPKTGARLPFYKAVGLVWKPGIGMALASIGFAGIASFITLFFTKQAWPGASLALTAFGAGYIIVRLFCAHFPDKYGGGRVAIFSLLIEIIGQLLIWKATGAFQGIAGAGITGIGMSLVFPSFGIMAAKKVAAENRGMAMAAYNAFFDLGMGVTAPLAGLISGNEQYERIYIVGAVAALVSGVLAWMEYFRSRYAGEISEKKVA